MFNDKNTAESKTLLRHSVIFSNFLQYCCWLLLTPWNLKLQQVEHKLQVYVKSLANNCLFACKVRQALAHISAQKKQTNTANQWGRNKCMSDKSYALCYGRVRSCAISNSFASYDGDDIPACCANKADCQWTQTLVTWSHRTGVHFRFLRGKTIQYVIGFDG